MPRGIGLEGRRVPLVPPGVTSSGLRLTRLAHTIPCGLVWMPLTLTTLAGCPGPPSVSGFAPEVGKPVALARDGGAGDPSVLPLPRHTGGL